MEDGYASLYLWQDRQAVFCVCLEDFLLLRPYFSQIEYTLVLTLIILCLHPYKIRQHCLVNAMVRTLYGSIVILPLKGCWWNCNTVCGLLFIVHGICSLFVITSRKFLWSILFWRQDGLKPVDPTTFQCSHYKDSCIFQSHSGTWELCSWEQSAEENTDYIHPQIKQELECSTTSVNSSSG